MEPQYNKPLYNEVLDITNNFLHPSNSKIYEKEPGYNETSLYRSSTVLRNFKCYIQYKMQLIHFENCKSFVINNLALINTVFAKGWQLASYKSISGKDQVEQTSLYHIQYPKNAEKQSKVLRTGILHRSKYIVLRLEIFSINNKTRTR